MNRRDDLYQESSTQRDAQRRFVAIHCRDVKPKTARQNQRTKKNQQFQKTASLPPAYSPGRFSSMLSNSLGVHLSATASTSML